MDKFKIHVKPYPTTEYAGLPYKLECNLEILDMDLKRRLLTLFEDAELYLVLYCWGIGGIRFGSLRGKVLKKEKIYDWHFQTFGEEMEVKWDKNTESPSSFPHHEIIPIKLFDSWTVYLKDEKYLEKLGDTIIHSLNLFALEYV